MKRRISLLLVVVMLPAVAVLFGMADPSHAELARVCLVTSEGGASDRGFNQLAWEGMKDARAAGLVSQIEYRDPDPEKGITEQDNLSAFIRQGNCDLIVACGYGLGGKIAETAREHPRQKMAIVDYDTSSEGKIKNLRGLIFQTDEASFLAGYVAAAMSKSGVIGTYGGLRMPPVTLFMEGYELGMKYYDKKHSARVQLRGWDTQKNSGLFTGSFDSISAGYEAAVKLNRQKADVIMPVAGVTSFGTVYRAIVTSSAKDLVVGVDVDFFKVMNGTPGAGDVLLTSVLKKVDVAVKDTIALVDEDKFEGGVYVGTLANGGVGIAPFHRLAEKVSKAHPQMDQELARITKDIIDGCIPTRSGDKIDGSCK